MRVAVAGAAFLLMFGCARRAQLSPQEMAKYAERISFAHFRAHAEANLAGHTVFYVDAVVKNDTGRAISLLQVNANFYDAYGRVVFREAAMVVKEKQPALAPGQSRDFRMAFEGLPDSWTRTAPRLEIASLVLE